MITRKTPLVSYLLSSAIVGAMTLLLWWLRDNLTAANISLLYILGTFGVAVWLGTGPSLLAALMTFFGFNFFLIKPYYTLAVEDSHELIDLLVYLLVAVVAGQLAAYARQQAQAARQHATEQQFLYGLSSAFNQLTDEAVVLAVLQEQLPLQLPVQRVEQIPGEEKRPFSPHSTEAYLLLQTGSDIFGTLHVIFTTPPTESQMRLLMACTVQTAMALQRIQLTATAQRSRALEEADQLKTALLRSVSHDLRTPITIIKTSADNLANLFEQLPKSEQLDMIRTIDQEANTLNLLVGNLLDLSRLQAGAMQINKEWDSLEEVIGDVVAMVWQREQQERVQLNFADDFPLARFDYGLIQQAVSNLVENSLRYEPSDSQIEIRGTFDTTELRLAIINHGPSIPDEQKEQIMEPFFHGRDGRIGLGLAISKGIIGLHHGMLQVEDTPGGGATFVLTLPYERPPVVE